MEQEFTELELNEKLAKYRKLQTLDEKLQFWQNDLKLNYANFLLDFNNLSQFHSFAIHFPPSENVIDKKYWRQLNEWLIENWQTESKRNSGQVFCIDLELMICLFDDKLDGSLNKEQTIQLELRDIDESFIRDEFGGVFESRNQSKYGQNYKYFADDKTYSDYLSYQLPPDYSIISPGTHTIYIANGISLAKYKIYLQEKLTSIKTKKVELKPKRTTEISIKKQLQILHYFGVLENLGLQSNAKKAEFLSLLLNKSEQNIRAALSGINELTTSNLTPEKKVLREELAQILELFEKLGLKKIAKTIRADIDKLQ